MLNRLYRWTDQLEWNSPFSDIKPGLTMNSLAILSANKENVINGYPDETFKPDNLISRGQMALMLARSLDLSTNLISSKQVNYKYVNHSDEIYISVQNLVSIGVLSKQDFFYPQNTLTRAQFAAMVSRTDLYRIEKGVQP
jgi:minor extracellular protease Epr